MPLDGDGPPFKVGARIADVEEVVVVNAIEGDEDDSAIITRLIVYGIVIAGLVIYAFIVFRGQTLRLKEDLEDRFEERKRREAEVEKLTKELRALIDGSATQEMREMREISSRVAQLENTLSRATAMLGESDADKDEQE